MRITKTMIAFAAVAPVLALAAAAQSAPSYRIPARWWQASPPTSPAPRDAHRMATDLSAHHVVMFGGWNGSGYLGDTWEYDGSTWTQNMLAGPRARALHALAYDEARGVTLLFGGVFGPGQFGYLGDTWQYGDGVWKQLSSAAFPPPRFDHSMVYDRARGRIVMFGGRGSSGASLKNDTWEWDGSSWTRALPAVSPTPRAGHAMAFDPVSGRVLLFGGVQLGGPIVGDMWSWDGNTWTQLFPAHAPSARWHAVMATDLAGGYVVLYGGYDGADLMDTWSWDGTDWTLVQTRAQPEVPALPAMTTGPDGRHILLFGGEDATGVFRAETWWFAWLFRYER